MGRKSLFTPANDAVLERLYPDGGSVAVIASGELPDALNTPKKIISRAWYLGLERNPRPPKRRGKRPRQPGYSAAEERIISATLDPETLRVKQPSALKAAARQLPNRTLGALHQHVHLLRKQNFSEVNS